MAQFTQDPFEPTPLAVLFDLDDTLCDYAGARATRLRIAFSLGADGRPRARDGVSLDRMIVESIQMHPHGTDHFGELFARHGIVDPAEAEAAALWYRKNRFHGLRLFPETEEVLRTVRTVRSSDGSGSSRALGVITNGPAEVQRAKLALLCIQDHVDFVIVSEEFGAAKPDPGIFLEALQRAGVRADEAVFVGDSAEFDIAGARGAGIQSIWVNRRGLPWESAEPRPTRQIRSLVELPWMVGSVP